jgi:hypothetical protein
LFAQSLQGEALEVSATALGCLETSGLEAEVDFGEMVFTAYSIAITTPQF